MPRSMTGFARTSQQYDWGTLTWEIRSVNHRYLEPAFRLPEDLREIEPHLRERIRKRLHRGKLEMSLTLQKEEGAEQALGINLPRVRQLAEAAHKIGNELHDAAPVSPLDVLRWPGVLQQAELNRDTLIEAALALFDQTLKQLLEHRTREGNELVQFIHQRLDGISAEVVKLRERLPEILTAQREKLQSKIEALKVDLDPERLEQEITLLAQKADVDEELDRLDTHVAEVKHTLSQKSSLGRRLDFLMQELNREANTLSSKAIVAETTQSAVELKVLIEQMREQIQNIE
ncbi:YicC family protein [Marinimicrobium sp. C6131]|uniref:YicC/YloC family endoribonuclease n=1 Tax=Marinimicrobium sp. C6131 TaxID=3022676 RepID=UPI00223DD864|nr:YicC/YloC family endoribonuclease [Marinimicrobium sp. C6131]UZJ43564.1 YicC family protein [Marinimicrobium sp. C6131]